MPTVVFRTLYQHLYFAVFFVLICVVCDVLLFLLVCEMLNMQQHAFFRFHILHG